MYTDDDLIDSYTRKQAINDGVLIDVTEKAKRVGFKYPVALTDNLWYRVIKRMETKNPFDPDDSMVRLAEILTTLRDIIKPPRLIIMGKEKLIKNNEYTVSNNNSQIQFRVHFDRRNNHSTEKDTIELKALVHAGDDGEPVITVMLPNED